MPGISTKKLSNLNKTEIFHIISSNKKTLSNFGARRIALFGSFINGSSHKNSDIDLLVDFNPKMKKYDNFIKMHSFLRKVLGRKVDLVTSDSLSPYFKKNILSSAEYVKVGD